MFPTPAWLRTSVVLLRYPALLAAIVLAAVVLAAASAAAPLFLGSAGSTALRGAVERTSRWEAGLTVAAYGRVGGQGAEGGPSAQELLRRRTDFLRRLTGGVEGLGDDVVTILGTTATVTTPQSPAPGVAPKVQLVARSGFAAHVREVAGGGPAGAWVPRSVAEAIGIRPGDPLAVSVGDHLASVPVQGIYADASVDPGIDFWSPLADTIGGAGSGSAPLLLMEPAVFQGIADPLDQVARFTWQFPLERTDLTLAEGRRLAGRIQAAQARLKDRADPDVEALFGSATNGSGFPGVIAGAAATVEGITGAVDAVSFSGRLIALGVIAAAGLFAVRRRRGEMDALAARGLGPLELAGKTAGEAVLWVAAGAAAGWWLAFALVDRLGPGGRLDPAATRSAVGQTIWTCAAGLLLLAAVAGLAGARGVEAEDRGRLREALARAPWEIPVLVLAAVAYLEVVVRGGGAVRTAGGVGRVDLLVLLFPVLLVAALAGLATRGLGRLLPRIRRAGERGSAAAYLASRRLAGATRTAMLLVTAAAVAVGVLVYAGSLVSSVRGSLETKALVLNGSDVRVILPSDASPPSRWGFAATVVEHVARASLVPTNEPVELIAVDPRTFGDAASTRAMVGAPSPSELARSLVARPGQRVPALVAGGAIPPAASLDVGPLRLPLAGVGQATAFPGMASGLPLLVVDRSALDRAIRTAGTTLAGVAGDLEVWARAPAGDVLGALHRAGIRPGAVSTVGRVGDRPEFQAVTWTFGLLEALGVLAGLIAAVAVVLFLQARQHARDVSYALASRMGLRRSAHRRSVLAEIAGMLAVAFALGVGLGMAGAAAVVGRIDLLPEVPPGPSVVAPLSVIGLAAAGLAVAVTAGAWLVQFQADRARVAEVMRRAA